MLLLLVGRLRPFERGHDHDKKDNQAHGKLFQLERAEEAGVLRLPVERPVGVAQPLLQGLPDLRSPVGIVHPDRGDLDDNLAWIAEHTNRCFDNLAAILAEAGSGLDKLVKTTVFLDDIGDFAAMNAVYGERVPEPFPARSAIEISQIPLPGALVEIEVVALV